MFKIQFEFWCQNNEKMENFPAGGKNGVNKTWQDSFEFLNGSIVP